MACDFLVVLLDCDGEVRFGKSEASREKHHVQPRDIKYKNENP